jgi:hypothetical protein
MNDLISRQAAIEAINKALDRQTLLNRFVRKVAIDAIKQLPPAQPEPSQVAKDIARIVGNGKDMRVIAQPEIIRCKDCKHWIPYDWMFSEVWQSRNINDYPEDEIGCNYCDMAMKANDFCSRGERREVTT